jgi:hypothetical protein
MGDSNYPTNAQRENWDNFLNDVQTAHPTNWVDHIDEYERARNAYSAGTGSLENLQQVIRRCKNA